MGTFIFSLHAFLYMSLPNNNKEGMLKFIEINDTNIPGEKEATLLGITID